MEFRHKGLPGRRGRTGRDGRPCLRYAGWSLGGRRGRTQAPTSRASAGLSEDSRRTGTSSWNYETREKREKAQYTQEHLLFFRDFRVFRSFLSSARLLRLFLNRS